MKHHVAYPVAIALYAMTLAAPAAFAQQSPAQEGQAQATAPVVASETEKQICKKEKELGSRLGGKKNLQDEGRVGRILSPAARRNRADAAQ